VLDAEYSSVTKSSLSQRVYGVSRARNSTEILNMGKPEVKSQGMKCVMVEASCGNS